MKRGFTIDINNKTNEIQPIELFTGTPLPEGVLVSSLRAKFYYHDYFLLDPGNNNMQHDYDDLCSIARMTNFNGNTMLVDYPDEVSMDIIEGSNNKTLDFKRSITTDEIILNGTDKYMVFHCPPNSDIIIVFEYM